MPRSLSTALLVSTLLFAACDSKQRLPEYELSGSALGTTFSVLLVAPADSLSRKELRASIVDDLDAIDRLASTWRDDSELSNFNRNTKTDWIETSQEFCESIDSALEISRLTDGAFDITVGPLVNLWGFGPDHDVLEPPSDSALRAVLEDVGFRKLQTRCDVPAVRKQRSGLYVDLSGWAKGYAVDKVAALLDQNELKDYLVEVGGELRVRGLNAERLKWAVAVETPSRIKRVPHEVLRVTDTGVATSGDYRNYFEHEGQLYSHTIDARTGRPVDHALAAVTVVNPSAAFADAMATALLVLGPAEGPRRAEELGIAAYFLIRKATNFETITTGPFDQLLPS